MCFESHWTLMHNGATGILCLIFVVQSLSHVRLFATAWTAACQASLSFTMSRGVLMGYCKHNIQKKWQETVQGTHIAQFTLFIGVLQCPVKLHTHDRSSQLKLLWFQENKSRTLDVEACSTIFLFLMLKLCTSVWDLNPQSFNWDHTSGLRT